jgi:uncharacterized membrane protein
LSILGIAEYLFSITLKLKAFEPAHSNKVIISLTACGIPINMALDISACPMLTSTSPGMDLIGVIL